MHSQQWAEHTEGLIAGALLTVGWNFPSEKLECSVEEASMTMFSEHQHQLVFPIVTRSLLPIWLVSVKNSYYSKTLVVLE